jgi:hypothetical protein
LLIHQLTYVHQLQEQAQPTITTDEFASKLRVWTETTTTSPSGLHLGHFKALVARHSFSTNIPAAELDPAFQAQREELDIKQQELLDFHLTLVNYALSRGYSFHRWQRIANTILFKDSDNVRLHRTRVIHIYEADYNLAIGVKWRAALHQAEDLKVLNEGQYGSRPNRNAADPVFIEELQCEISRATRKPIVFTNYDATACYDRIIPNLGMLASQKFGAHPSVTLSNASTLENADYRVSTALGLSTTGYTHTNSQPIYGTGQGSANSTAIWCFLSSALFDCYDSKAALATYSSPASARPISVGMVGFVDDCNGQTNLFEEDGSSDTVQKLVKQAQHNAQTWNDTLTASGGALEVSKTSCHVLQWLFAKNGAPVLAPLNPNHKEQLQIWDTQTQSTHQLEVLSVVVLIVTMS